MKNFGFVLPFIFTAILSVACTPNSEKYHTCATDADCSSEEVCYGGLCFSRCNSDSDCMSGFTCISGVCLPGDAGIPSDTLMERVKEPAFSPPGGMYNEDIEVTIACETEGATIYYTLDGTEPTPHSLVYSGPIPVAGHANQLIIRVIAVKEGYEKSLESLALYTINYFQVAPPQFSLAAGEFYTDQTLQIRTNTAGAEVFYTINGDNPTPDSLKYAEPLHFPMPGYNGTYVLRARAYKNGLNPSEIFEASYSFVAAAPVFDPLPGVLYQGTHLTLALTSSTEDAAIFYTTDLSVSIPDVPYSGPFDLDIFPLEPSPIIKALAVRDGMWDSQTASGRYDLPTGKYWHVASYNGGFDSRTGHTSVVFKNKMWVIGGSMELIGTINYFNDVWNSENGAIWTSATYNGGFTARYGHTSVVFDNKMWVIGGMNGPYPSNTFFNDVWHSENGVIWTQATDNGGFPERGVHTSVVFDNKIWLIAGANGTASFFNDVWYSENGVVWTPATDNADFSIRCGQTSVVFDNKMWVIGGASGSNFFNDVWWSENGVIWTQAVDNGGFAKRMYSASVVFDNKMWLIGGVDATLTLLTDVWYSEDGALWFSATDNGGFAGRALFSSPVFDNKIWLIGGASGLTTSFNDVWWSD